MVIFCYVLILHFSLVHILFPFSHMFCICYDVYMLCYKVLCVFSFEVHVFVEYDFLVGCLSDWSAEALHVASADPDAGWLDLLPKCGDRDGAIWCTKSQ